MKKLRKLPLIVKVLIAIVLGILLGFVAPTVLMRVMNTVCSIFSQFLGFIVPLIIVGLVTPAISRVGKGAGKMLGITVLLAYTFTVLSGLFSYGFSSTLFPSMLKAGEMTSLQAKGTDFAPYFTISFPPLMDVMTALVLAFMLGLGIAALDAKALRKGFTEFEDIVTKTISSVIIPLLPLFIFGLFLDMSASGKVGPVLVAFAKVIAIIFVMTLVLLIAQYSIAGIVAHRNPFKMLVKMLPAYLTALGTSSSAATIPVTLRQAKEMGVREDIAGFVIPLCATVHLSGSMLKITSCAIALMMLNGMPFNFMMIFGFILLLAVTMVAAPGVPGGAIMAAIGILESSLGFDASLQAMMITVYIAMDSFGTACNVTGDGSIAMIMSSIAPEKKE
ncbi:MAG: dicarboxylate/amino acid:cation symporter [Bacteroidales bacterium]|nr:dicarboxylate/amino acid:cation symporter [Candidatus Sodaliphilus aphodohippi]